MHPEVMKHKASLWDGEFGTSRHITDVYWEGDITLIDFPQVVSPKINRNAFSIFQRDVTRVCEYFAKQGVSANPRKLAVDLWTKHGYRTGPEIHPRLLDADDERDRALWQKQRNGR